MALAADEERALSRIEDELRRSDPKLAAKLAMFNRLTQSEAMPERELLTAPGPLRRVSARAGIWVARWRLYPPVPARGSRLIPPPGPARQSSQPSQSRQPHRPDRPHQSSRPSRPHRPSQGDQPQPGHLFSLSPRPGRQPRSGPQTRVYPGPADRRWPTRLLAVLPLVVTVCALGAIVALFSALSRVDTSAANRIPASQCHSVLLAGCQSATTHGPRTAPRR